MTESTTKQSINTPSCDALAREHIRINAAASSPGVVPDWIALAQSLERELAEVRADLSTARQSLYEVADQRNDAHRRLSDGNRSLAKAEVRLDDKGEIDEVCAPGGNLEYLDHNHVFLELGDVAVWLHSVTSIHATYERREPGKWLETRLETLERELAEARMSAFQVAQVAERFVPAALLTEFRRAVIAVRAEAPK